MSCILPTCAFCKFFDRKHFSCPAYPKGIPESIIIKDENELKNCSNEYHFTPKKENEVIE